MGPIEKFIQENREHFDTDRPGLPVWANIEKGLKTRRKPRIRLLLKWVAMIALLLTVGGVAGFFLSLYLGYPYLAETSPRIPEELVQAVEYYHQEVNDRMAEVGRGDMEEDLIEELDNLDLTINQLKEELKLAPVNSKETVFSAVVQAYESKLELLERFINGQNQYKDIDHDWEHLKL